MIYPIVRVTSVVGFLSAIAGALAEAAAQFGVHGAEFRRDPAGLWLGDAKLAACGIHIARGVSVHGWALDVATPAEAWQRIRPCGLSVPQTSIARAAKRAVTVEEFAACAGPLVSRALL
jgi:lipoyl(octanoyl) transferase